MSPTPMPFQHVIVKRHPGPMVALRIITPFGSSHDQRPGLAHFAEHMAFKGTESVPVEEFNRSREQIGDFNAYTDFDRVVYWCKCLPEDACQALDLLVQMVSGGSYPESAIEVERSVICEEIAASRSSPTGWFWWQLMEDAWGARFGMQAGTEEHVQRTTREELLSWKRAALDDCGLAFVACGDLSEELCARIESLRCTALPVARPAVYLPEWNTRPQIVRHASRQAHVALAAPGVDASEEYARHWVTDVAMSLIGGGTHSLMWNHIREQLGLCYSVCCFHGTYSHFGYHAASALTSPERAEQVSEEMHRCLKWARDGRYDRQQLDISKQIVMRSLAFSRLTASQVAAKADHFFSRADPAAVLDQMDAGRSVRRVQSLTAHDVSAWIERAFGGSIKFVQMLPSE